MATVLGKRTRSSTSSPVCSARSKRVSRQIKVHSDESQAPLSFDSIPSSVTKETRELLTEFEISTPSHTRTQARPSKHGLSTTRVQPKTISKPIDAHFAISKSNLENEVKKSSFNTPPITPSHRAEKNPTTPQNRVLVPGSVLTPRTPATPNTISKPSPYAQARQIFTGCADQVLLIGREQERTHLTEFIDTRIDSASGGCIYVSGPPGTGKSAFVGDIIQQVISGSDLQHASVNCMSIKTSAELTQTVVAELNIAIPMDRQGNTDLLKHHFTSKSDGTPQYLLVLDEIDRLVELDLKLLYSLFEWSTLPQSRLILVGIANALDLTDRLLPKLKSRNIKPSLLPFMPYTAPQINDIITAKLRSLNGPVTSDPTFVPFLHPAAISLCSKKVASQTGDLRKAFDIVKRALTLIENETRIAQGSPANSPSKTPLSENINLSSPPIKTLHQTKLTNTLSHLTPTTAPRASIAHVAKVTSQIFSNGMSSRLSQLNIQQKAVLCTLSAYEKRARTSLAATLSTMTSFVPSTPSKTSNSLSPTTKQLYDLYADLCKRENLLHALSSVEFKDVLSGLETLSLIEFEAVKGSLGLMTPSRTPSRKGKKSDGFGQMALGAVTDRRRVSGVVGFNELRESLTGAGSDILKEILEG